MLWAVMHPLMCDSLSASWLGSVRDGSSLWQTGHSSSSRICGVGGRGRCVEDEAPADSRRDPYCSCEPGYCGAAGGAG
ncbi:hypothetical protein IMZ48_46770 [Candidatus Bathyarchaeota archaeon]|nr:hypothetical protein [Candidatus Bathyarchaeota archaeon]